MRTTHRAPTQKIKIMGLFDGLGSSVIGSFLSGIFGSRQQKRNLEAQQRENSMARQFNEQQAALTRQFNSAEAEKSRQFQERMYQLYESPIAQAQQRQQAGLPMEATSMSVGSSSTASASPASTSPASLPAPPSPWSDLGESVKQLPFIRHQIRAAILDNQQRELEQEKTRAETFKTWQEGYQTQIENGFTAEEKKAIIDNLKQDFKIKGNDDKLTRMQIEFIEGAKDAGINPVVDTHNESVARVQSIYNEIENDDARLSNEQVRLLYDTLKTQADTDYINSLTDANEFYRQYIQPLEAYITRANVKGANLDNKLREANISLSKLHKASEELQMLLAKGDYQGFVGYVNYYLKDLVAAVGLGVGAGLTIRYNRSPKTNPIGYGVR